MTLAGNETSLRIQADYELEQAKKNGVSGRDLAAIQGRRDALRARELSATGQSEQARSWF